MRILSIVPKWVADLEHMALEDFRLDEDIGPQRIEQFVLSNQPAGAFDQIPQDSKRLRCLPGTLVIPGVRAPPQTLVRNG